MNKVRTIMANVPAMATRRIRIFLCHASGDKPVVRELYQWLTRDGFQPWLDEEDLLAGQDWEAEIKRAVHEADVVLVCLSQSATTKRGFVQKEIKFALDVADELPLGTIFIIPVRLEDCSVPDRLGRWHWVDFFPATAKGYEKLLRALRLQGESLGIETAPLKTEDDGVHPSNRDGHIRGVFRASLLEHDAAVTDTFSYRELKELTATNPIVVAYAFLRCCLLKREPPVMGRMYYTASEIEAALTRGTSRNAWLNKLLTNQDVARAAIQYFKLPDERTQESKIVDIIRDVRVASSR
jgi:hypothetical protein